MTPQNMLIIAITALTAAVLCLWRHFEANNKRLEKKHDECDADRQRLWKRLAELEGMACRVAHCPMRQPLEDHHRSRPPIES